MCRALMSGRIAVLTVGALVAVGVPVSAQAPPPDAATPQIQVVPVVEPATLRPRAFGGVFKDTLIDFRRLPTSETATILALGGVAALIGHSADRDVSAALSGSDEMGEVLGPGRYVGGPYFQIGGALATYVIGRAAGSPATAAVGADLVRAGLVVQALTHAIKVSTQRSRPNGEPFSFPSGHTSSSFAAATVLQRHFGWKAGVPAYAVATYVGASRIQQNRHYLSDVAFGAALGIVVGRTVTFELGGHRVDIAPAAAPGGGGVSLSVH
jgi:membrane-associated phospholipid phosphatase